MRMETSASFSHHLFPRSPAVGRFNKINGKSCQPIRMTPRTDGASTRRQLHPTATPTKATPTMAACRATRGARTDGGLPRSGRLLEQLPGRRQAHADGDDRAEMWCEERSAGRPGLRDRRRGHDRRSLTPRGRARSRLRRPPAPRPPATLGRRWPGPAAGLARRRCGGCSRPWPGRPTRSMPPSRSSRRACRTVTTLTTIELTTRHRARRHRTTGPFAARGLDSRVTRDGTLPGCATVICSVSGLSH